MGTYLLRLIQVDGCDGISCAVPYMKHIDDLRGMVYAEDDAVHMWLVAMRSWRRFEWSERATQRLGISSRLATALTIPLNQSAAAADCPA